MEPDDQLLRRYAEKGDERAFAEIVQRNLPLVYGTAVRLLHNNRALAEEVAQGVFTDLARKAPSLSSHPALAGWLHTSTRYRASKAARGEQRRNHHEQKAAAMTDTNPITEVHWEQVRPELDEAVGHLRESDREAVLLRYFQGQSYPEIERRLGWSPSTAHKHIERALEKLRRQFARRGVTTTTALLASALSAGAATQVPAGLAGKVTGAAVAAGMGGGWILPKAIYMSTKTKIIATAAAVALLAAIPITVQYRANTHLRMAAAALGDEDIRLQKELKEAQGRATAATPDPAGRTAASPSIANWAGDVVRVDLATVGKLNFSSFAAHNFKLTNEAISLLGMTPTEQEQVQAMLGDLKKALQQRNLSVMHELTQDEVAANKDVSGFFKEHGGQKTAYVIPGYSDEEEAALKQSFTDSVDGILGPDRGAVFVDKANLDDGQMPGNGGGTVIAFADGATADGKPDTQWMIKYVQKGQSGGATYWGNGPEAVPDRVEGLFDGRSNTPPAAGP